MKVEDREYEILKTTFKTSHNVMSGGGRERRVNVTMTSLIFFKNSLDVVWWSNLESAGTLSDRRTELKKLSPTTHFIQPSGS